MSQAPVPVRVAVRLPDRPPESVEVAAYYVVCECLRGLADRVEALGGSLRVRSLAGGGTLVRAVLPCG